MFRTLGVCFPLVAFALAGCQQLGIDHDVRRIIDKPVEVPNLAPASVEAAARVDSIGRELLAGTPLGIPEVAFHTVGSAEPEIFHHDSATLYVTEGLVNSCKRDDELAAVLASEIAQMTAEFRRTARKTHPQPIPTAAMAAPLDRTTGYDPGQELYLAQFEKHARKPAEQLAWPTVEPATITADLLRNAGIDPKAAADVQPLLKAAGRNHQLANQFKGTARSPRWSN